MKRISLLTILFALLCTQSGSAQLLLNETFDYADKSLDKVAKWSSTRHEDNEYEELKNLSLNLVKNTLSYQAQGKTYADSDAGQALAVNFYVSKWVQKQMITPFARQTKGNVYMAFMLRLDELPVYGNNVKHTTQFMVTGLSGGGTSRGPVLWVKKIEGKEAYQFGLTLGSRRAEDVVWDKIEYTECNKTHLIALKYNLADRSGALFINPTPGAQEPAPSLTAAPEEGGVKYLASVFIYLGYPKTNQLYTIAGIRVAGSWAEAVAAK